MNLDIINGLLQLAGSLVMWINVCQITRDKEVKGVSWIAVVFFTALAYWSIFYFSHLGQTFSAVCSISAALANSFWLGLYIKYQYFKRDKNE